MTNQDPALTAQLQRLEQFGTILAIAHEQLRPRQLVLLAQVADEPGLTQTELADRVGLTTSALSRNLDALGLDGRRDKDRPGLGWIESKSNPDDDRHKRTYITEEGQRVLSLLLAVLWP